MYNFQSKTIRAISFKNTWGSGGGRVERPQFQTPPMIFFHVNPPPLPLNDFFHLNPPTNDFHYFFKTPYPMCFFKYNPIPHVFFLLYPPPYKVFFSPPHPLCFSQCSTPPSKTRKMQLQDVGGSTVALSDILLLKHGNLQKERTVIRTFYLRIIRLIYCV